ncbi:transcriptional regulator [Kitasatospora sp. MMS16-BH015]|uniref:AfsR/SARP family transcriptional regulator n=1 Tax=Kitasatospora sp. MMS16-BH015 TaxID=2018025 RepID=UPI000CA347B5|nr:AfsR/SARP family transcriptional regulator [Kitasatospora sp. MMS16-BH015]AUG78211.1 transcriptional regulator [Kitasatospora sp. MMS16-BH015]
MDIQVEFGILGPLSAAVDGRRIGVGGPRQRTILALLLLRPGRVVSVDAMVEAVWQGDPPATARTQVAICIGALRKTFKAEGCGDEVIVTAHPGYQLNPAVVRVDLLELQELTAAADQAVGRRRTAEAAALYERALGLWRGPVLAGVTGREIEDEAARLEEVRLAAFEGAAAVQLTLGQNHEVIGRLTPLVQEHPLRENARHSLMLAQYRAGRRAEAMETFRDGRRRFIDELGLEPGAALQQLHDAILRDDPSLTPPEAPAAEQAEPAEPAAAAPAPEGRPTPSFLPPNVPAFTGRGAETAALDRLIGDRSDDQPPAIAFITGVAGVGKTGLAVNWSHRVAGHFPDGRLFADLCGHDETDEPTAAADVLSRFLRAMGVPGEQIPAELDERISLYRSVLADRRVLVVLDNVRTIGQILPLLPNNGRCCVVVTSREPLEQLMLRYGAVRVQLGVLPPAEAVELLARIVPEGRIEADPVQAARLGELCDRLPLALRIAAARLASKPHWTVKYLVSRLADERRRLDELSQGESRVRASFALSYRYLPKDAARLYRRLALVDVPDFTPWVGAALLDVDAFEAERLMEQLVDVQLLEVVGGDTTGQLRYRMQNLLRLFAKERVLQEESERDQAEGRDRALRSWLTVAEQAHAREYGGHFGIVHGATPRYPVEPELVEELIATPLDWFEAERLSLIAVIDQAARLGLDDLAWDLCISTVVLFETRNYVEDWELCAERARAAAQGTGNLRGQAVMLATLGAVRTRMLRLDEAVAYLDASLALFEQVGEEHGRAIALRALAIIDHTRGDLATSGRRLTEATELFRQVGDLSSEAHALGYLALAELAQGRPKEAVEISLESMRISRLIGETRGAAQAAYRLGRAYLMDGQPELAEASFAEAGRIVREKGDRLGTVYAQLGLGETRLSMGLAIEAEGDLLTALEVVRQIDNPLAEGRVRHTLGLVCRRLGRIADARGHLEAACELFRLAGSAARELAEQDLAELDPTPRKELAGC